jgi:hypothetical protein
LRGARDNFRRAETIMRAALGDEHSLTQKIAANFARFRKRRGET